MISGLIAASLIGVCISFAEELLSFWLGSEFGDYHFWLILKLGIVPFYVSGGVFAFTYRAWNKVKIPAVITVILGVINLMISYIIFYFYGAFTNVVEFVLLFSLLISIIQCYILNAYIFIKIYTGSFKLVFKNFIKISLTLILSSLICYCLKYLFFTESFYSFIIIFTFSFILSLLFCYYTIIFKNERIEIIQLSKQVLKS